MAGTRLPKGEPPFFMHITPKQAAAWLSHNEGNRPLDESRVAEYERKMRSGEWREGGGAPVWVTADGRLVNGQHRLLAVVRLGRPVLLRVQIRPAPELSWQEAHGKKAKAGRMPGI
jgi:hypothetical protein